MPLKSVIHSIWVTNIPNLWIWKSTSPLNNSIEKQRIMMGCYGIGISRIIAAIAEINRDEKGLKWPRSIAPWEVTVVEVSKQKQLKNVNDNNHHNNPQDNFQEIYNILNQANIDYRLDNRSDSMGKN